jgi:hypothetical protein
LVDRGSIAESAPIAGGFDPGFGSVDARARYVVYVSSIRAPSVVAVTTDKAWVADL